MVHAKSLSRPRPALVVPQRWQILVLLVIGIIVTLVVAAAASSVPVPTHASDELLLAPFRWGPGHEGTPVA